MNATFLIRWSLGLLLVILLLAAAIVAILLVCRGIKCARCGRRIRRSYRVCPYCGQGREGGR